VSVDAPVRPKPKVTTAAVYELSNVGKTYARNKVVALEAV